jgi:hypothetical protein
MLECVVLNAKRRGYITTEEVLELYPKVEDCVTQVDELFATLIDEGVEIILDNGDNQVTGKPVEPLEFDAEVVLDEESFCDDLEPDGEMIAAEDETRHPLELEEENYSKAPRRALIWIASQQMHCQPRVEQMGQVPLPYRSEEVVLGRQIERASRRVRLRRHLTLERERTHYLNVWPLANKHATKWSRPIRCGG